MRCPDPELLAAFVEGQGDARSRELILDHVADCDLCRHVLLVLGEERAVTVQAPAPVRSRPTLRTRLASRSRFPWAVAALLLVSVGVLLVLVGRLDRSRTETPEGPPAPMVQLPTPSEPRMPAPPPPPPSPDFVVPEPRRTQEPGKEVRPIPKPEEPAPEPAPAPVKAVPPEPAPRREPAPPPATIAIVGTLDRVEGEVYVQTGRERIRAKSGSEVRPGEAVLCLGARSGALFLYADHTRLEVSGEAVLRDLVEAKGKRVFIEKGSVKAEIAKQPKDQPMIFATPQGEARVVGTVLRLVVSPDPKQGTSLEVEEGRVDLVSPAGKKLEIGAGHSAALAVGVPFAPRLLAREEVALSLGYEDGKRPALLEQGTVERGPAGRLCLAGDPDPSGSTKLQITGQNGLFTFAGDEVLTFDYWTDPQASQVNFNFWDRNQGHSHDGQVTRVVTGKWTRVSFRLGDLGDAASRFQEGDWVAGLYMQATGPGPRKFFVDNLVITRTRSLRPRLPELKK